MSDDVRVPRPSRSVAAHTLAWMLVALSAYDGAALLIGGPDTTTSDTYAALRLVPGGMATWGGFLLAGAVAVAWGIGRDSAGHPRALNAVLAVGVGYYTLWASVIVGTWVYLGDIVAITAPSKAVFLAGCYYVCARAVAPPPGGPTH